MWTTGDTFRFVFGLTLALGWGILFVLIVHQVF